MALESTYQIDKTAKKAGLWLLIGTIASSLAGVAQGNIVGPTDLYDVAVWLYAGLFGDGFVNDPHVRAVIGAIATGIITAIAAAVKNWWKNAVKNWWKNGDKVKYVPSAIVGPLLIGAAAMALQGCAGVGLPNTLSKPVEHETKLNITQPPTMNPDGTLVQGETTEYYKKWRGGAGVESTKSDNLRMGIDKDGNWYVEQGEASNLSTQGQVQGITEGMKLNLEAIMAGYALGSQGLGVAGGLIGQKLQFDATSKAQEEANQAEFRNSLIDTIKTIVPTLVQQSLKQQSAAGAMYGFPLVGGTN